MTMTELAEKLFAAFENSDSAAIRDLCTPDLQAIQNHAPPIDIDTLLAFSAAVQGVVQNFRYEDVIRTATTAGFVEEHSVRGTLPDGSELRLPACVVAEVRDGKIAQLREYADGAAAKSLIDALSV